MKASLIEFFERELLKVKEEIGLYPNERDIWEIPPGIANSGGTLCLHLIGNLNHFIGATLGNSGYVRNRELEFSARNVPRAELIEQLDATVEVVGKTLQAFPESDFDKNFPLDKHGKEVTNAYMILHLLTHLNYHLGQINYHRRLITNG